MTATLILGIAATSARAEPAVPEPTSAAPWSSLSTAAAEPSERYADPHTCGVTIDGALACWGEEDAHLGSSTNRRLRLAPMGVGAPTGWVSVSAGGRHTCALDDGADLWCWGENGDGQLGIGSWVDQEEPTRVEAPRGWTTVDATYSNTCGITDDGGLWCWGANDSGQLGDGTTYGRQLPKRIAPERDWIAVAVGSEEKGSDRTHAHTCGIATDRTLWCWGENDLGQLGLGPVGKKLRPVQVGTDNDWASVTAAAHATCATRTDASLWCWGSNQNGRLGDGTRIDRDAPVEVAGDGAWASVDAGRYHTCGVQVDASAWCWGRNANGRLGDGTTADRVVPTAVVGGFSWAALSSAYGTTCGLAVDGTGMCWGTGGRGQRGDGMLDDLRAPDADRAVRGIGPGRWKSRWAAVAGGRSLACGIVADGRAACWSENSATGLPSGGRYAQPIHDSWTWRAIDTGTVFVCGVRQDGGLFCGGQPGFGYGEPLHQLGSETSWTDVGAGYEHACALQDDHSLWCWGGNSDGQLGTGDFDDRDEPVQVEGSWALVDTGDFLTCGIQTDGSLWCWGDNSYGQLGLGTTGDPVPTPQRVGERQDWLTVSANSTFACGTAGDHEALCWGHNNYGQLGDGTLEARSSPGPVIGPSDWQVVVTEHSVNASCGLRVDGSAWCWGENFGQFGNGQTAPSTTPVPAAGGRTFTQLTLIYRAGCGVTVAGRAWCWGQFEGDGTVEIRLDPVPLLSVRRL